MYGVKVVYKYVFGSEDRLPVYEEQVLHLEADSLDDALEKAEEYAQTYCDCGEHVNPDGEQVRIECFWVLDCCMSDQEEVYSRIFTGDTWMDEEEIVDMLADNCAGALPMHMRDAHFNPSPKGRYDVSFSTKDGRFSYRVRAVIVHEGKLLTMKDEHCDCHYLPGGKVRVGEPAETAVLRKVREALDINAEIVRPLWVNQTFATGYTGGERFHELCIYFLIDVSGTDLLTRGEAFSSTEPWWNTQFEWIPFEKLEESDLSPYFIRERILKIPQNLELITTIG